MWAPIVPQLGEHREVLAVDLPGHGGSPPSAMTPGGFAREVAALMDELGIAAAPLVGLSIGGWTALEMARAGRATGVLALVPAGLWAKRSPFITDLGLQINWRLGRVGGARGARAMRSPLLRRLALGSISAHPERVPADLAVAAAEDAHRSDHFPEHFGQTRVLRFTGGAQIPSSVPVTVVWADRDRVARPRTSQHVDQLPEHARVETWRDCGHMLVWDAPGRVVAAALALPTGPPPKHGATAGESGGSQAPGL